MWAPEPVTPALIQSGSDIGEYSSGNSPATPAARYRLATPTTTIRAIVSRLAG